MKLYSLSVFHKGDASSDSSSSSDNNKARPPRLLKAAYSLSSFGFFQRSGAREFMAFTSALLAERCSGGSGGRASVREKDYRCHVHARSDGMAAVLIADGEYPQRVCFTLLEKALDDFSSSSSSSAARLDTTTTSSYDDEGLLDAHLARYQDPREADALTRARAELDETRVILHDTVESLLERGERLDDLVAKSEHLRFQSKVFYRNARRKNECCVVM